jgi:hypothetical protein
MSAETVDPHQMQPRLASPVTIVWCAAVLGAALVVWSPAPIMEGRGEDPRAGSIRYLRDDYDRAAYAERGSFLRDRKRPYVDVYGEYPQVATYLFALPYLVVSTAAAHMLVFTFMMAASLGLLAILMARMCRLLGIPTSRVLFLLLPGTLYFSLNRFDVLPETMVMLALLWLVERKTSLAHAALGIAILTKGYPLAYVPLFLRVAWESGSRNAARAMGVLGLTIGVLSLQLIAWIGLKGALSPYVFQGNRDDNTQSLFHVVSLALPHAGQQPLRTLFSAAQAMLGAAALGIRSVSPHNIVRWLAAMTIAFVVFMRFQSPQWAVWITPLAILASRDVIDIGGVVAQDVLSYLYFPLAYDAFGPQAPELGFVVGALTAARLFLLVRLIAPHEGHVLREAANA